MSSVALGGGSPTPLGHVTSLLTPTCPPHHHTPPLVLRSALPAELALYNGRNGKPAYIACDGIVFDLTTHPSWQEFYGEGSGYNVFVGKCASVGLACMELNPEKWTAQLSELTAAQQETLNQWTGKYLAKYGVRGCLSGRGTYGSMAALQAKLGMVEAAAAKAEEAAAEKKGE
jgi:hypothetical protein